MSSQYPEDPYGTGPGANPPNPFSREGAGDGAGLGPTDQTTNEPTGYVGLPGGPGSGSSPDAPYAPPAGAPSSASDPYQTGPHQSDSYQSGSYQSGAQSYASGTGGSYSSDQSHSQNPYTAGFPPNPYQQTTGYPSSPYGYPQEQHPKGTAALVMGILGLVICPFVGVAGFVVSSRARREVNAAPNRYSNAGMITAGWVLGIISIVYAVLLSLYLVVVIIAVIFGIISEA